MLTANITESIRAAQYCVFDLGRLANLHLIVGALPSHKIQEPA